MKRVAVLVALLALVPAGRASAAPAELASWWYLPQQLPNVRLPSPPNVPDGGLLVQHLGPAESPSLADVVPAGALSGTPAFGAVHTTATPGSTGTLTLHTATGSTALTAKLRACATTSAWNEEDGAGPWFARPTFDEPCVDANVSGDGSTVTFPISTELTRDGVLDVAIVPAAGATPFSVAFAPPGDDAVDLHGGGDGAGSYVVGPPPSFAGSTPVATAPTTTVSTVRHLPKAIVPMVVQAATAPARDPKLALLLLAAVLTTWAALSRRRTREPRSLLRPVD